MGIPTPFSDKVGGGKMQTSSPPVITPNRSQSNPDDIITLPRPIQSVGMDLHDVSGTSTGQTLPRERRAPPGTHFCPTIWWVYPHLLLFLSSTHYCPLFHPLCPKYQAAAARILRAGPQDPKHQASSPFADGPRRGADPHQVCNSEWRLRPPFEGRRVVKSGYISDKWMKKWTIVGGG